MKIQDLKDNRNEILSRINEIAETSKTKEIMQTMVSLIETNSNESNDVLELVDEVVEMLGYEKKHDINKAEELRLQAIKNQRSSSLR